MCGHLQTDYTVPQFVWCSWIHCQMPAESSEWFSLGCGQAFAKFDATPLLKLFSHFAANENSTDIHYTHSHTRSLTAFYWHTLQVGKNSCMRMKVPYTLLAGAHLLCLTCFARKKIKVSLLFEQTSYNSGKKAQWILKVKYRLVNTIKRGTICLVQESHFDRQAKWEGFWVCG